MLIYLIIAVILSMYAVEEENLLEHITAVNIVSIIYLHAMIQNVVIIMFSKTLHRVVID